VRLGHQWRLGEQHSSDGASWFKGSGMHRHVTRVIAYLSRQPRPLAAAYVVAFVLALAEGLAYVVSHALGGRTDAPFLATAVIVTLAISVPAVAFVQSIMRDLRESQALLTALVDEVVKARDEALRTNHFKSQFLSNLSHELRTPLNSIIGFSQMLQKQPYGPLGDARYLGYVDDISLGGRHLLDLINDILALSKLESGVVDGDNDETADVDEVMLDAVRLLEPLAAQRGVSIARSGPPAEASIAMGERMLRQILFNILSNAVKFTDRDGLVRIMASRCKDGGLVILVHDTGVGMSADEVAVAMTPFGRVPNRLGRVGDSQGTGLGLPLVRAMMELQNGSLQIDSIPDDGTIVSLVFPAELIMPAPGLRRAKVH
jgi:signal transduction histidine kinase